MDILRQFESYSEGERSSRIGQYGVSQALLKTPPEEAIAWLDRCLPSSVSSTWGRYLARCEPTVVQLMDWLARDGSHKLAALDAMRYLSDDPEYVVDEKQRAAIADQLDQIENSSPAPRVQDLLGRIRHNWKLLEPRDPVQIPEPILSVAECLFSFQTSLVEKWSDTLQDVYQPPETPMAFWASLANFAGANGAMAICDHREDPTSVVEKLSSIRYSKDIPGILLHAASDEPIDVLCKDIAASLKSAELYIASLDSRGDAYWLTINYRENLLTLENRLAAAMSDSPVANIY